MNNLITWQCQKCGDVSTTLDINPKNTPRTCYDCCIDAKHDQEGHSSEEMDASTCNDLVPDMTEAYEFSQNEEQADFRSDVVGY
jgi:hypothetical protein